uniref:Uncharacterized protein n=1 Tax=Rhodosorus marinus TaxID=101924 RepID=A0A7S3A497_9RHOD
MQAQLSVKQVCPYIEKPQTHQQQRRMSRRSLLQAWLLASSSEDTIESPVTSFLSEAANYTDAQPPPSLRTKPLPPPDRRKYSINALVDREEKLLGTSTTLE